MYSLSAIEIREELQSAFPPGVEQVLDFSDIPGDLLQGAAETLEVSLIAAVDQLRIDVNPLTCTLEKLRDWERNLLLSETRTARLGSLNQRRAQVIAHLRLRGAMTLAKIRAVVAPCLDYPDPSQLVILETDRATLRAAHTYPAGSYGGGTFGPVVTQVIDFWVDDDGPQSAAGAQVDLTLTHPARESVRARLFPPSGGVYFETTTLGQLGTGAIAAGTVRANFAKQRAPRVLGPWQLQVFSSTGVGQVTAASLFVEGFGRRDGYDGLSAAKFEYGVVYDPALSSGHADLAAALLAMARIRYATRIDGVIYQDTSAVLPGSDHAAIPDANAVPDASIPG